MNNALITAVIELADAETAFAKIAIEQDDPPTADYDAAFTRTETAHAALIACQPDSLAELASKAAAALHSDATPDQVASYFKSIAADLIRLNWQIAEQTATALEAKYDAAQESFDAGALTYPELRQAETEAITATIAFEHHCPAPTAADFLRKIGFHANGDGCCYAAETEAMLRIEAARWLK